MTCSNCGTVAGDAAAYCPNCGMSMRTGTTGFNPAGAALAVPVTEDMGRRVLAYLIDIVPMLVLALVHFLPVVGWMFYGLIHICYWLLRDITGSSPGKTVLGSYVASEDGSVSTTQQRIVRNIPLAVPGVVGLIPFIGWIFEFFLALAIFGTEAAVLLVTGRRIGDRIAGTNVVKKFPG